MSFSEQKNPILHYKTMFCSFQSLYSGGVGSTSENIVHFHFTGVEAHLNSGLAKQINSALLEVKVSVHMQKNPDVVNCSVDADGLSRGLNGSSKPKREKETTLCISSRKKKSQETQMKKQIKKLKENITPVKVVKLSWCLCQPPLLCS